jgi:hypothetical protein
MVESRRRVVPPRPPQYISRDNKPDWGAALGCLAILAVLAVVLAYPIFEARHFNKCTGGNATYFDALFTTLRVTECVHEEPDASAL